MASIQVTRVFADRLLRRAIARIRGSPSIPTTVASGCDRFSIIASVLDMILGTVSEGGFGIIGAIVSIAMIYPAIMLYAKRWHDRGKSGWWTLIVLVPIIGGLWILVELGFLKGTDGTNQYGPDPLAG